MERSKNTPSEVRRQQPEEEGLEESTLSFTDRLIEMWNFKRPRERADAPFRHTDLSTFEMVYNNLEGVVYPGTPVIDKDRSGGASRLELQAYLREVRRSTVVDKHFVESYRNQFLGGFSDRDLNKDGELQPEELPAKRPERSYEDEENRLARAIDNPSRVQKQEIEALRASTSPELLARIDRLNSRKDHRVEKLLLEFLKDESPEAQQVLKELYDAKVRVVMRLLEGGPRASVNSFKEEKNEVVTSVEGLKLELSPTLNPPYASTFRNELLHVRVLSKVARELTNGKGFPLSEEQYQLYLDKIISLDHEIVSSVAQVTAPGEKATFHKFYERLAAGEDPSKEIEKPESYFARAYGLQVIHQRSGALPIRELLLSEIDKTMSERELKAFENFSKAVSALVMQSQEGGEIKYDDVFQERLQNLNPSSDPDFYYR